MVIVFVKVCGFSAYNVSKVLKDKEAYVCHCKMCRRWTGGMPLPSVEGHVTLYKQSTLRWYKSSQDVCRAFCLRCGSLLFWYPRKNIYTDDCCIALGVLVTDGVWETPFHIYVENRAFFYSFKNANPLLHAKRITSESAKIPTDGKCLCGAIIFSYSQIPKKITLCHCALCRRRNGGMPSVGFVSDLILKQGNDKLQEWSNDSARYYFCSICGSSLFWCHGSNVYISVGAIDDAITVEVEENRSLSEKPSFYDIASDNRLLW